MVKKKRQTDPSENGDESTESCDESVKSACPHVAKAVDLMKLKRALRIDGFAKECSGCKKNAGALTNGVSEATDPDFEEDLSLWMCLRCGAQLCGRSKNKHALNHYNSPHSDCHALTTNSTTWEVYCYNCDNKVTVTSSKKLHECIEFIKKQANTTVKPLPPIELNYKPLQETIIKTEPVTKGKDKASAMSFHRVKGLSNLGNTCFFNSVLQCLVQTPYLLDVLQEMASPGEKFTLPGGKLKLKAEGDDDDANEVELPAISGELAEWGVLTRTLAETLQELQTGEGGVFSPKNLLAALVNKHPQFGGCDQHDAHELLRHLLEAVRSEDLRRYQHVILKRLGMNPKVDPARVEEDMKQKVKFYGQQASDTMLRPEQVFRGFLVSTLECQECYHQSDRAEYFLDLSLPVAVTRPQPPALLRRKTPNEDPTSSTQEDAKPSKHQLKKERIAARKAARKNKSNSKSEDGTEQQNGDGKSSSESDADVEDNLDEAPAPPAPPAAAAAAAAAAHTAANFAAYHLESGYNSEKVISSDSIRTSPVNVPEKDATPEGDDNMLKTLSNPDSGVASPDATKHNSTETVDNVDSPIAPKELGSGSSLDEPKPTEPEPERPPSRADFAPIYNNEVVSRGISARAGRSLVDSVSPPPSPPELAARLAGVALGPRAPSTSSRYSPEEEECSVQSCLAQFTALELLTGNNKVGCESCTKRSGGEKTVYTNATKRFLVSSPPAILILHLKRFQLGPRCMFRKMSRHVDFSTVLDLAPFCAIEKIKHRGPLLYSLYGVVEHSGGMHGGHYVAYVKVRSGARAPSFLPRAAAPVEDFDSEASGNSGYESGDAPPAPHADSPPGKWYYVSDSMVSEASEEKVLRAQAYLLFYERIM